MDDDDDGEEQENIDVSDSRLVGSQYLSSSVGCETDLPVDDVGNTDLTSQFNAFLTKLKDPKLRLSLRSHPPPRFRHKLYITIK